MDNNWERFLYRPIESQISQDTNQIVELKSIPYHAWANRDGGAMQLWYLVQ